MLHSCYNACRSNYYFLHNPQFGFYTNYILPRDSRNGFMSFQLIIMNLKHEARVLRDRIKEMEGRMRDMERWMLMRYTPEPFLPKLSVRATVAPSATTVDDALFKAPIALKALLPDVPSWAQVIVKGKKRMDEQEVGAGPDPVVRWGNVAPDMIKIGGVL